MEDISDSELRKRPGRELNGEITSSELRSECCDSGNDLICGSDNVLDGEVLKRNEFSFKSDSRVCIGSNAAKYKLMSPARLPISRSPCLTIPPGLSPTSLLDSPILLSNAMAEPSPTTGSFSKSQMTHSMIGSTTLSSNTDSSKSNNYQERCSNVFEFKPQISLSSVSGISSLGPVAYAGSDYKLCEKIMQVQDQCQSLRSLSSSEKMKTSSELNLSVPDPYPSVQTDTSSASVPTVISSDKLQQQEGSDTGVHSSESIHKVSDPSTVAEKSAGDGYNWRKYGQKHVKGSEFPRSYYKCTHPNCEVKKQLERSLDGRITEIIYKGRHDHPKPQPRRQLATSTILSIQGEAPGLTGTEDESTNVHGQTSHHIGQNETPGHSPVIANDEDRIYDEIDDEEDDDPELKRRKTVMSDVDVTSAVKPIREPRVVVQTVSEVDILDDGYRWRKYGQKVVKGNPNPRSYYKCTNTGCPVRKHVERAYNDPKAVITTYEGKHNHDVPAARNCSHDTGGSSIYGTALNGTVRTTPEDCETISLDLGVGINLSPENGSNDKLQTAESFMSQSHFAGSGCKGIQATPVPAYSHVLDDGVDRYASSIQEGRDGFSFQNAPLSHTHNQFPGNVGRLLSGPQVFICPNI